MNLRRADWPSTRFEQAKMNPSSHLHLAQTGVSKPSSVEGGFLIVSNLSNAQITALVAAGCLCVAIVFWVSRQIYFAANPDKRPIKRKRRK